MVLPNLVFVAGVVVTRPDTGPTLAAVPNSGSRQRVLRPVPFNAAPTAAPE